MSVEGQADVKLTIQTNDSKEFRVQCTVKAGSTILSFTIPVEDIEWAHNKVGEYEAQGYTRYREYATEIDRQARGSVL